jgi:hypothetical protein
LVICWVCFCSWSFASWLVFLSLAINLGFQTCVWSDLGFYTFRWCIVLANSQSTGCGRASGSLPGQSLAGHPELGTHAPFWEFNSVKQGQCSETIVPRTKCGNVDEAETKVPLIPPFPSRLNLECLSWSMFHTHRDQHQTVTDFS